MSKGGNILLFIVFCCIAAGIFFYINSIPASDSTSSETNIPAKSLNNDLTIASWNLQIFGQDKASDAILLSKYASIISKYDVIFVQEIRDISETSFQKLCEKLPGYSCLTSSRAGRTSSKEQYGLIYRKGIIVLAWTDYNNEYYQNQFERPPVKAIIQIASMFEGKSIIKNLTIWNIHTKPDDVSNEMTNLETIVTRDSASNEPMMITGDLNADCSYYDNTKETQFDYLLWAIGDDKDTTVGTTDCTYDRIITNFGWAEYGIDNTITSELSDHYLVWVKI